MNFLRRLVENEVLVNLKMRSIYACHADNYHFPIRKYMRWHGNSPKILTTTTLFVSKPVRNMPKHNSQCYTHFTFVLASARMRVRASISLILLFVYAFSQTNLSVFNITLHALSAVCSNSAVTKC
jgi:hypothetical protein